MDNKKRFVVLLMIPFVLFVATIACDMPILSSPTPTPTPRPSATPTSVPTPTPTPIVLSDLQLNLQAGDTFHIHLISDQKITQTLEEQTDEMIQTIGYGLTYTVTEIDDADNAWIRAVYDWATLEQESAYGSVQYDSTDPPDVIPDAAIGFHALIGQGLSMKFSPAGDIVEIRGLDELYASMFDAMGITDTDTLAMVEQMFEGQFSEEALTEQFSSFMMEYPTEALHIGDSWSATMSSSFIVPMVVETTYTFLSLEGDIAAIELHSVVSPDEEAELLDLGVMQLGYSMYGEQDGFMEVDIQSGWTMSYTISQSMSGEMLIYMSGEELSVPMTLEASTTLETTKE